MDSPHKSKKANPKQGPKRSQNQSSTPLRKDAYARLLSQHNSSKFSLYLKQHMKDTSFQKEGQTPSTLVKAQSDRLDTPQQKREQVPNNSSDSFDPSPSTVKHREESSLSLFMEKLATHSAQLENERKQGVSNGPQRGQRRDTTTSYDGDVDSGEELYLKCSQTKKQQKENKDSQETNTIVEHPQSPKKASATKQEQKVTKSKKKVLPKKPEEDKCRAEFLKSADDTPMQKSKCPHDKKLQQSRGKLIFETVVGVDVTQLFLFGDSCWIKFINLFQLQVPIPPLTSTKEAKERRNKCLNLT